MNVIKTHIPEILILEPKIYDDERGFFYESYNKRVLWEILGIDDFIVQGNHSYSAQNVLRGFHYQINIPQGKFIQLLSGEIFDVVVDLRKSSPTFGHWVGKTLKAEDNRVLWVPKGFAHGFLVLSESAQLHYQTTEYYDPQLERSLRWDDPQLAIPWPIQGQPILSAKDRNGQFLHEADIYP